MHSNTQQSAQGVRAEEWPHATVELTLVWNMAMGAAGEAQGERLKAFAAELWRRGGAFVEGASEPILGSLWANFNVSRKNNIVGPDWLQLHGAEELQHVERFLPSTPVVLHPASFVQVRDQTE